MRRQHQDDCNPLAETILPHPFAGSGTDRLIALHFYSARILSLSIAANRNSI
jgi:hypothetical protein